MKKILSLICFFICSCKSITYQDVNPTINPNENLLPALDILVDMNNLEAMYSVGSAQGSATTFGTGYTNSNNWSNWVETSSMNTTFYKDIRVHDTINIFTKEVEENISNIYGEKKGYISLKLNYRDRSGEGYYYMIPYILTAGISSFFGCPIFKGVQTLEVEVKIYNKKKEIIKKYVEKVVDKEFIAMYWGYNPYLGQLERKLSADNTKQALEKIRKRINTDSLYIKNNLK